MKKFLSVILIIILALSLVACSGTKQKLNEILAANTNQPLKKIAKDLERDYYLTASNALAYGLIDKVLTKNLNTNQDN